VIIDLFDRIIKSINSHNRHNWGKYFFVVTDVSRIGIIDDSWSKEVSILVSWDVFPLITKASLERAHSIIAKAEEQGAKILLDGRNPNIPGYENGNFLAPTVIDNSNPGNISYDEEIFAPVMSIVRVDTLDDAIELINNHPQGNGVAIFT
jgi:hypothetical protein